MAKKNLLNRWTVETLLLTATSIWVIYYSCTTKNVQPLLVFIAWLLLIPIATLRLTLLVMLVLGYVSVWFTTKKQYRYSQMCAKCANSICSWWFNLHVIGGGNLNEIIRISLQNLKAFADTSYLAGKLEESAETNTQIVELASRSNYYCYAAKACDSLSLFFRKKKDNLHARHWAERGVEYYACLSKSPCSCGKVHKLNGKHAALEAWLARDSQRGGLAQATELRAKNAKELIASIPNTEAEVALVRLMDVFFETKNWDDFKAIADRYLTIQHSGFNETFAYIAGKAWIRLGIVQTETGECAEAKTAITRGTELAERIGRDDLKAQGESAMNTLRQKEDTSNS